MDRNDLPCWERLSKRMDEHLNEIESGARSLQKRSHKLLKLIHVLLHEYPDGIFKNKQKFTDEEIYDIVCDNAWPLSWDWYRDICHRKRFGDGLEKD